jgi:hypothetical protein
VSLTGSFQTQLTTAAGPFTARRLSLRGVVQNILSTGSSAFTAGDVLVSGGQFVQVNEFGGTFAVHNLDVRATAFAALSLQGTSVTVAGNLRLTGGQTTQAVFAASVGAEVKGDLVVTGGPQGNTFTTNGHLQADRNLTLSFGDGPDQVAIGDGSATVPILGRLTIGTGAGDDAVTIRGVEVTQRARVSTGAGSDVLTVDLGSKFDGTFFADLGTGDDQVSVAQDTSATAPVTFVGTAIVLTGAGNDRLLLGLDPAISMNANTAAVFTASLANRIDGGAGLNVFDGLTPDQAPARYAGLDAADFLHWTDPNP